MALISAHAIAQEIGIGRLAILGVAKMPVIRNWFSVSRADRTPSPAMVAFEAFLREHGRSFLPDVIS
ncbi:MAG: LysR family transcriptional regulator, partial [Devosia sp.]|nr:LysR family transcriptional regulator [Devosia sp.]